MTGTRVVASAGRRGDRAGIGCLIAMLALAGAGVCPADILNPSFETTYAGLPWPRPLPEVWGRTRTDHPSFNSYCTNLWRTDGALSAGLFNRIGATVSRGNYQSFGQWVDLTGISGIEFDVRLVALPAGEFANFEASLVASVPYLIGVPPVVLWRQTVGGVYLNQRADVPNLSGWYVLEIRNTALVGGAFGTAYWTQWDNLRLVEGPTTIPVTARLEPGTLNLASAGKWVTCYLKLGEGGDVGTIDGATVTLNDIPAYLGEPGWATPQANDENVADFEGDGILERMVKFERAAVQAVVQPPEATMTIKGRLTDGTPFEGTAVLRVLDTDAKKK